MFCCFSFISTLSFSQTANTLPATGNVGVGTTAPNSKLQVVGNTKLGGTVQIDSTVIIKDSLTINKRLTIKQDIKVQGKSVFVDDGKFKADLRVLGIAKMKNKLIVDSVARMKSKLVVDGVGRFNGNLKLMGDFIFGNNKRISYLPAAGGYPEILGFGKPPFPMPGPCNTPTLTTSTINQFQGMIQAYGHFGGVPSGNLHELSMGYDGANGIIDMAGLSSGLEPRLLINYYCGKDVLINTGTHGGSVILTNSINSTNNRVGIGADFPLSKLDVNGQITMRTGAVAGYIPTADANGTMTWTAPTSMGIWSLNSNTPADVFFNTGNVGIGTSTPEDKLQVGTNFNKLVVGSAGANLLGWGTSYIGFNASRQVAGTDFLWHTKDDGGHDGGAVIYGDIFGGLRFSTIPTVSNSGQNNIRDGTIKDNTRLYIREDGNIGMGTEKVNGYKLSVEGNIRAREVEVNPDGWSDFVFDDDYLLSPLTEIEAYIFKYRHLPNVPSAKEVKEKGIDLGKMNAVLLQKIEELTLYSIEQQKQMDYLLKEIEELKKGE